MENAMVILQVGNTSGQRRVWLGGPAAPQKELICGINGQCEVNCVRTVGKGELSMENAMVILQVGNTSGQRRVWLGGPAAPPQKG